MQPIITTPWFLHFHNQKEFQKKVGAGCLERLWMQLASIPENELILGPIVSSGAKNNDASDDPASKRICARCVGEAFLKALITEKGAEDYCFYRDNESKTFTIEEMADLIDTAFDAHYERTPTEPDGYEWALQSDPGTNYQWERTGKEALWAIEGAARIEQNPASDIRSVLADRYYDHERAQMGEESPFDERSHYVRKSPDGEEFIWKWSEFEKGLKTEARYFSRSAYATLGEVFEGIVTDVVISGWWLGRLTVSGAPSAY